MCCFHVTKKKKKKDQSINMIHFLHVSREGGVHQLHLGGDMH